MNVFSCFTVPTAPQARHVGGGIGAVVLVVDDDPAARRLYHDALAQGEFSVNDVDDGITALLYLESHEPAAVVLDLALPRLHGRDVLKEMAAHDITARIPVVVVTGTDEQVNAAQRRSVLAKPVTGDALLAAVRRGINARRRRQLLVSRPPVNRVER